MRKMVFFGDGVFFEEKTQVEKKICCTEPLKMSGNAVVRLRYGVGGKMGLVYKVRVVMRLRSKREKVREVKRSC